MSDITEYIQRMKNVSISNNLLSNYDYKGNSILEYLFSYLLYKKHNLDIPPESLFCYNIHLLEITNGFPEKIKDISDYFKNSSQDKTFLILNIDLIYEKFNHDNLIIYDRRNNTLEHYEPNGYTSYESFGIYSEYINGVIDVLYKKLRKYITGLKFISSIELHGFDKSDKEIIGLQTIEGRANSNGHCQMWCYLLADLVTKFPEYSTKSIIKTYLDLDNNENLSKHNLHRKMKMIIRGFYFSSMKQINKLEEFAYLDNETINTSNNGVMLRSNNSIKNVVFLVLYHKEYNFPNYSSASVVKSYILTIGIEKTLKIFEIKEEKSIILSIYKHMKENKFEQFFVNCFRLTK